MFLFQFRNYFLTITNRLDNVATFKCQLKKNLTIVTDIFLFHFACDWRVNVTGFLCFSLLTVIFTQFHLN